MRQVASTQCRVDVIAPNGTRYAFQSTDVEASLLRVSTEKDLNAACGSFHLEMTAIPDAQGRTWDEIIPMRSLVAIMMERDEGTDDDPTVMVGLTDEHVLQEDMNQAIPRRSVRISGREISCVIVDAVLWYHARLAVDKTAGVLSTVSAEFGEQELALIFNPKLLANGAQDPLDAVKRILDYYLFMGSSAVTGTDEVPVLQQPLINLDLPHLKLADLLQMHTAEWNTFQPVKVPYPQFVAPVGSLWNYLHIFIDTHFQEFFTRIEDGVCRIHFRGKPFLHESVMSGTRFKSTTDEPTLATLTLDDADILTQTRERDTSQVYNVFVAIPLGLTDDWDDPNFSHKILPSIVKEAEHPSFVCKYGLRILEDRSPYLTPVGPSVAPGTSPPQGKPLAAPPAGQATFAPMAAQIATQVGMPVSLVSWYVANIKQESMFDPQAKSTKGALGLAQLTQGIQDLYGVTDPYDPVQSLTAGARYFRDLASLPYIHNDPQLVAAAYNAGPGAVRNAGGQIPNIAETQNHVRKVSKYQQEFATPGAAPNPQTPPPPPKPPITPQPADSDAAVKQAQEWGRILRAWYEMGGELFGGTITVRGHPSWNVGHRLVSRDRRGEWEAYIEGCSHSMDLRTGQYLTQLRYTRGWYVSGAVAEERQKAGHTMVTETSGGPPDESPPSNGEGPTMPFKLHLEVVSPTQP